MRKQKKEKSENIRKENKFKNIFNYNVIIKCNMEKYI